MHPLEKEAAAEIRNELQKSLALMPDFGPAQHLLGFFEMVQGEDLSAAEKHIERAIQLEPENQSYLLTLAQVQLASRDPAAARRTLEPLLPALRRAANPRPRRGDDKGASPDIS